MTVRFPHSTWHPLPEAETQPRIVPTQGILHTVVGHANPYNHFNAPGNGSESTGWIDMDGTLEQYISADRSADANWAANRRPDGTGAWSFETQDNGAATLDETPWTEAQCSRIVELMVWANDPEGLVHDWQSAHGETIKPLPLLLCPTPDAAGWGYHSLHMAWNQSKHSCPGKARIAQVPGLILRAQAIRTRPQEDEDVAKIIAKVTGTNEQTGKPNYAIAIVGDAKARPLGLAEWSKVWGERIDLVLEPPDYDEILA